MKLLMHCTQCSLESDLETSIQYVEIQDDNLYQLECPKGHKTVTHLSVHKFELLFDSGALALHDGYTREAVASFAAALERFHEFCIRSVLLHRGVTWDDIERTWKQVGRHSQRELGAFYVLYLLQFQKAAPDGLQKWESFRNDVIHKGIFPEWNQALNYGDFVLRWIVERIRELREEIGDDIVAEKTFIRDASRSRSTRFSSMAVGTLINTQAAPNSGEVSLREALKRFPGEVGWIYRRRRD